MLDRCYQQGTERVGKGMERGVFEGSLLRSAEKAVFLGHGTLGFYVTELRYWTLTIGTGTSILF